MVYQKSLFNMSNTNNLTGNAGEYFVCSELSKLNFLPLLTQKNNPLFDIIVTNNDGSKYVVIQVKTMGLKNEQGWKLSTSITSKKNNDNLFLVLVNLKNNAPNDFYLYKFDDFVDRVNSIYESYLKKPHYKTGESKKDVNFRWFNFSDFNESDYLKKTIGL